MKKRKVRIIAMPKAGSGLEVKINSGMGFNARQLNWPRLYNEFSAPDIEVRKTITGDPNPNIEAEGGETIVDDRDKDGIAEHYKIGGPRHTHGGVDINAGENAFVFSDTKAMKIGGDILKAFNKSTKKKLTPADIAKQYDINEYLKTLKDPDTDDIQRKTAEQMIANYNKKLGALALLQESKKGFDAGVPVIAHDYLESIGMNPEMFTQNLGQSEQPDANMARYGGSFPKAQTGNQGDATLQAKQKELSTAISNAELRNKVAAWNTPETPSIWQNAKYDILTAMRPIAEKLFFPDDFDHSHKIASNAYDEELRRITAPPQSAEDYFGSSVNFGSMPANTQANPKELQDAYDKKVKEKKAFDSYYNNLALSLKPKLPSRHYSSKEEYQADLLSPYSPEKRAAQMEWLAKQKKTSASSPMPGVNAEQVNVPLTDTTGLSSLPFQRRGGQLNQYWLGGQNGEGKSRTKGDVTEYQDGSMYNNKTKTWIKNATVAAPAGQAKKAGKGSGSFVSPYGEDADIIKILTDYGVKDAGALYDKNIGRQKANAQGVYGDDITEETWRAGNPGFLKQFETNGNKFKVTDKAHMKQYEKYHYDDTYNKIYSRLKTKMTDAEAQRAAKNVADNLSFSDRHKVSKADQLWGNYHRSRKEIGFNDPEQQRDPGARVETRTPPPDTTYTPTVNKMAPAVKANVPDEYWLQDSIRQHGNARDYLTLKKYMPWQATPDVQLADGIFEDPNRAIAGVNETVNAQNQLMGTFAGPQGLARSQASARGANQIADIIAQTANRNVGYANDLERYNNQVGNQGSAMRAGMATNLFDKTTIANQQFDNSQRAILHNMDDTQIAAETNRAYTHNLNQINPHFNIHPEMGGNMAFTGQADPFAPSYEDPDAWLKKYTYYKDKMAGATPDEVLKAMKLSSGNSSASNPYANMAAAGMYPGGNTPMDPWG